MYPQSLLTSRTASDNAFLVDPSLREWPAPLARAVGTALWGGTPPPPRLVESIRSSPLTPRLRRRRITASMLGFNSVRILDKKNML